MAEELVEALRDIHHARTAARLQAAARIETLEEALTRINALALGWRERAEEHEPGEPSFDALYRCAAEVRVFTCDLEPLSNSTTTP